MEKIIQILEKITSRGYSHYQVFQDWLDLMIYAFIKNDPEYMKIVKRYKNTQPLGNREMDLFADATCELLSQMAKTNDEILGELYMSWNISNKYTGQFFTPKEVASMMAQMLAPKGEYINEPSCGSGIMIVETCKTMTNSTLDNAFFVAQDIDYTCVRMCALNMMFFNLNGLVIWGDALEMNDYKVVFQTSRSYLGGSIRMLSAEEIEAIKPAPPIFKIPETNHNQTINQQLSIF